MDPIILSGIPNAECDRLYNRVAEHVAAEHVTSWDGCPLCEGDIDLATAVYGGWIGEPIAWLYQEDLYHPLCMVATIAPPTMAAYTMTTDDPESIQIEKARVALGVPAVNDYGATWPVAYPLACIEDADSCAHCGELIDPT